jgi:membrane fusion protein, copper/silver efflux system
MKPQISLTSLLLTSLLLSIAGGSVGYWWASMKANPITSPAPSAIAPNIAPSEARKVLYWYDPMVPNQRFDKPGKSPFMDMELVPKYADDDGDVTSIKIDPNVSQNLGLRVAVVEHSILSAPIAAVGTVKWNEREIAVVQARSSGFVERVYARAPGDILLLNDPLADLLIPEWAGAQAEFLALRKTGDRSLIIAAQERLKLMGMPAEVIEHIKSSGQVHPIITIRAPQAGVIQSLEVRAGMSLAAGMPLATINGTDPIWLEAAIPEAMAEHVAVGNTIHANLTAYPDLTLAGKVIAILPETDTSSRTLRVRAELSNPEGRLKAGMFARMSVDTRHEKPVTHLPSEAIIRTGLRNIVLIALAEGRYQPAEVKLGQEINGRVTVLEGLHAGQHVVASGQFLIDSEASLKGVLARLSGQTNTPQATHDHGEKTP